MHLEEYLASFGIQVDAASNEELNAIFGQAVKDESWLKEFQADFLTALDESPSDLWIAVGDRRSTVGDYQNARKFYELAARQSDDPGMLNETAYGLLQRSGIQQLPIHESRLSGHFEMGGEESLEVYAKAPSSVALAVELHHDEQLLTLARLAFGRAWLMHARHWTRWFEEDPSEDVGPPTWEERLKEVLALDGLRAVFIELEDIAGFRLTELEYATCADDWPDVAFDVIVPVEQNFRESAAYFRGLEAAGGSPKTSTAVEEWLQRRREWRVRMDELQAEIKAADGQSSTSLQAEELLSRFADLVEQLIAQAPGEDLEIAEGRAKAAVGSIWDRLPRDVKRLLVDAEYLRPLLAKSNRDWFPVVIAYSRSVEILLRCAAESLKINFRAIDSSIDWSRASIGEFSELFLKPNFGNLRLSGNRNRANDLAVLANDLRQVNRLRNSAAHGEGEIGPEKARELRDLLFGQNVKLFQRLANAALLA